MNSSKLGSKAGRFYTGRHFAIRGDLRAFGFAEDLCVVPSLDRRLYPVSVRAMGIPYDHLNPLPCFALRLPDRAALFAAFLVDSIEL